MNRVVQARLKSLRQDEIEADLPIFHSGSSRPNQQFRRLCKLVDVKPKQDVETGEEKPWVAEGSEEDVCDLLRRTHARVIN